MVSQLTTVTGDGQPSENAMMDCVAASIDAACRYLLGTPENSVFNPDHFKDVAVGQGYTGGTAARDYVPFCASLGVHLWNYRAMPALLVSKAHQELQAGHPVIFTESDPYVSASLGWTHTCVFFSEGEGYIVALDPYIAKPIRRTDAEWTAILLENEIWLLERSEDVVQPLDISMPAVAAMFEQLDATHWKDRATGRILQDAHLADYKANGVVSLERLGHMISPERYLGDDVIVNFEFGVRAWSKTTGKVRSLALYDGGTGTDPAVAKLQAQLTAAQAQPAVPQEHAALVQIKDILSHVS